MEAQQLAEIAATYDRVVDDYVENVFDELKDKPLDRQLLDRFALRVRRLGTACDLGCGPGHVARYLHERGAAVRGIDLSPEMVKMARQLNPEIEFDQGNMLALDLPDESLGGIAAFYSIIHVPPEEVVAALRECHRVLKPGGLVLLAFHVGQEVKHLDEWYGHAVQADFYFFRPEAMTVYLREAEFEVEESIQRAPYEGVEYASQRAYLVAHKRHLPPGSR
jgi:SAM-dependent methyltransferase